VCRLLQPRSPDTWSTHSCPSRSIVFNFFKSRFARRSPLWTRSPRCLRTTPSGIGGGLRYTIRSTILAPTRRHCDV
jgi:hypothetical protein